VSGEAGTCAPKEAANPINASSDNNRGNVFISSLIEAPKAIESL
jgi:hypothetical protein